MFKGKFIAIEGGDGAGKTTFINFLKEKFSNFVYSREPGGKDVSQLIRILVLSDEAKVADPLSMFHLFWASSAENFAKLILPALQEGRVVVTDRFDASTYAFQIGENPKLEEIFWQTRAVCLQGVSPIYINFNISNETSRMRLDRRGDQNHFDARDDEYRNRVRASYDKFFFDKRIRSITVDADLPQDQMLSRGMGAIVAALNM